MAREPNKDEILGRLMEAAAERWGREEVERLRPALERAAEAVRGVEEFHLAPEEEPVYPTTIFRLWSWRKGEKGAEEG